MSRQDRHTTSTLAESRRMPPYWASITSRAVLRVLPRRSTSRTAARLQAGETSFGLGVQGCTCGRAAGVARADGLGVADEDVGAVGDVVGAAAVGDALVEDRAGRDAGERVGVQPVSAAPPSSSSTVRRLVGRVGSGAEAMQATLARGHGLRG